MTLKPIVPRELAISDVNDAVDYYLAEVSEKAAGGFVDELEQAYERISRHPAAGSPRYAHELNLPGLRSWSLQRYPQIIFYVERNDHIDVWRILHGKLDIPSWLQEGESREA